MEYLAKENEKKAIHWLQKAAETAQHALCDRAKCGTVIVKSGKIIGHGYNAPPLDNLKNKICYNEYKLPQKFKYDRTCCVHAEWRAIMDGLKRNSKKLKGSSLYFSRVDKNGNIKMSGSPYCTVCSRMALDAGIEKFILWHKNGVCEYPTSEYNKLSYQYAEE